jgi:hypothetical protein
MTNQLVDVTGAGINIDSKGLTLTDIDSVFINKHGDTMSGDLNITKVPSSDLGAVPKKYVDSLNIETSKKL